MDDLDRSILSAQANAESMGFPHGRKDIVSRFTDLGQDKADIERRYDVLFPPASKKTLLTLPGKK